MKSRRHVTIEENQELNLVPYMDIMVNLIIFMLFTMTGFIEMKIINVSVPAIAPPVENPGDETPPPDNQLAIILGVVHKRGFMISLNGQFMEGPAEGLPTIPVLPDGNYDYEGLQKKLTDIQKLEPTLTALTIAPDKKVDYKTLVKTMDEIRRDAAGNVLFPDVLLGVQ